MKGNIIIDIGENYKLDLELCGLSLISEDTNPVTVLSGNKVTLTAKRDFASYIYDEREAVTDKELYSAAVYSMCDLEIAGRGSLTVSSKNNNGVHSKDDLEIKNLTLTVTCVDNALKGNDSVAVNGGKLTLIATGGDGIKTVNSSVSEKGKQKGNVTVNKGEINIFAACDGIDSAHNVEIDSEETVLNIYTDKYSNYSKEITTVSENICYIRFSYNTYKYSVKYYNSDTDYKWANASYHSKISGERSNYYYYSYDKIEGYGKVQIFIYSENMEQGQQGEYLACTDYLTVNESCDTFAISQRGGSLSYSWTNYSTKVTEGMPGFGGGMGGMNEGNQDKGTYSTKGIKASNEIVINNGKISIKAYDDTLHADGGTTLQNGEASLGNITVNNGELILYSNDDGIHAYGTLLINGGAVSVVNSYEGLEAEYVNIKGGAVSVFSKDDGINSTKASGTGVEIDGGNIYIYCSGDGIDSNSRSSYSGIKFSGGSTVIISISGGNSAIDTEAGYSYSGGRVVAIMPTGGMSSEATHCMDFSSVGKSINASIDKNEYLTVKTDGEKTVSIKFPTSLNGKIIYLGSASVSVTSEDSISGEADENGVFWY